MVMGFFHSICELSQKIKSHLLAAEMYGNLGHIGPTAQPTDVKVFIS